MYLRYLSCMETTSVTNTNQAIAERHAKNIEAARCECALIAAEKMREMLAEGWSLTVDEQGNKYFSIAN